MIRLGIGAHQVGGHESTETPTVHADAVGIHIGKGFQESHTRHLVGHFNVAEVAMRATFKLETAIL